jgi:hypothetical protein
MMHYLAAYISRKRPEAAAFIHELEFARSLSQVQPPPPPSPFPPFCLILIPHPLQRVFERMRPFCSIVSKLFPKVPIDLLFNEANVLRSWFNQVQQSVQSTSAAAADDQIEDSSMNKDESLITFVSRASAALVAADAALTDLENQVVAVKALLLQFCRCNNAGKTSNSAGVAFFV